MAVVDWTTFVYSLTPLIMTFVTMFLLVYFIRYFGEAIKSVTLPA